MTTTADPLAEVRRLLDESHTASGEGSRLIREAIRLREEALAAIPVGTSIWFTLPPALRMPQIEHVLTDDGWIVRSDDGPDAPVRESWISEEWARGSLRLDKDETADTEEGKRG